MPDFIEIHEPNEENLSEIVPYVLFNRRGEELQWKQNDLIFDLKAKWSIIILPN